MKKFLGIMVLGFLLTGCGTTQTTRERHIGVDEHYTFCANQYNDIRQIAPCGKNSRNAYINRTGYSRSNLGNRYVIFMDTLAEAVDEGSLTNTQAKLEWMKLNQQLHNRQTVIINQGYSNPYPNPVPTPPKRKRFEPWAIW